MARQKPVQEQREYVEHVDRPAWGVGLLVSSGEVERTYVFADGARRTFKVADCGRFLRAASAPVDEARERLEQGRASGGRATPRARNLDFVAQLSTHRDDPAGYLAYADWLQLQRDPRGELMVVQLQRAERPRERALQAAEGALLAKHRDYFLPPLLRQHLEAGSDAVWRYGFLSRVRLVRKRGGDPLAEAVRETLVHPSSELLETLELAGLGDRLATDAELVAITKAGHRQLEHLHIDGGRLDRAPHLGELSLRTLDALPRLRRLVLRGERVRLGAKLAHPHLATLVITTFDAIAHPERLVRAKLPALATLELDAFALDISAHDVQHLLAGAPALRRLALRRTVGTGKLLAGLAHAPELTNLEVLDLSGGDLRDEHVRPLLESEEFAKLRRVDVSGNSLSRAVSAAIALHCPGAKLRAEPSEGAPADGVVWTRLGRDDALVWGEADTIAAFARIATTHAGCTCRGKQPCPHVRALHDLVTAGYAFTKHEIPDEVMDRILAK